ncbi:terminase large subunit [Novosphingobium sp. AP12]|uniref:terminase large subunit n=1 Tax=Novosphingobium sp. AP12 TaxID=1144305 RepID=UPI0002720AE8|nr:terminase large subunit [Novosphingobium sp. AP12]EJL25597.1 phage terminase-like protein, large subunit [Novosphingobium sp. AP12]
MDTWNFACLDWKERLRDGRSLIPDLPLDREMASRAVQIFNKLRLPDVGDRPEMRVAAGDWQRDTVAALFGSMMPDGRRRVRKIFELVPKKNSKTTKAGAIGVTALLMDPEPRQPYYLFGPTQEIAQRGFNQAEGMIMADPVLQQRFHVRAHLKTIVDRVTESTLKVQTFDEKVSTGGIPKGAIIDELHILGKVHYASRVLGQIYGGMVSRPGAFLYMITTQSDEPPAGVFKEELQLARAIRDGRLTGEGATTLPILYEFPEEFQVDPKQPWMEPTCWPMVLPNLGRSVQIDLLRPQFYEAKEKGSAELARWASQHLNIEIGLGLHSQRWRGADHWLGATEPALTLEDLLSRCEVVVCGVDGGGLDDLFGVAVLGRERVTGTWLSWARAWVQRNVVMAVDGKEPLRKDIAPRLLDFEREGTLVLCDSATQDIEEVAAVVEQVRDSGLMPDKGAVGIDPLAVGGLVDALTGIGLTDDQLVAIGQGFKLSSAVWSSERKLRDGTLRHDGSDMMAWCVGNAKAEQRGNAVYITKEAAGKAKIDPLCALFNAVKLMERNPVAGTGVRVSIDDWIAGMRAA